MSAELEVERQMQYLADWVESNPHVDEVEYGLTWGEFEDGPVWHGVVKDHLTAHLRHLAATQDAGAVCEIGTGGGRFTQFFGSLPESFAVHGYDGADVAFPFLRRLVKRPLTLHVSPRGSMHEIGDESLDLVFSYDTFVHFEGDLFAAYLAEIVRTLKPGGRLMLHYARDWGQEWPIIPHDGTCFIEPPAALVDALHRRFRLDAAGMYLPIHAGFGSVFWSMVKQ